MHPSLFVHFFSTHRKLKTENRSHSEIIRERPVDNHFHAQLLDAGFSIPQHKAVWSLLDVLSLFQDETDPLLPLIQVAGTALELHGLDIRHWFLALVRSNPQYNRLHPFVTASI
mgnify:FL=1